MPILTLRRRQRRNNALAFGLSLLLVLAVYALLGFAPFGDGTLLTGDLNGLYVNYITDMWRRVRQGGLFSTASPSSAAAARWGCSPIT